MTCHYRNSCDDGIGGEGNHGHYKQSDDNSEEDRDNCHGNGRQFSRNFLSGLVLIEVLALKLWITFSSAMCLMLEINLRILDRLMFFSRR